MPHHPAHESSGLPQQAQAPASPVALRPGQTIVFFGDNITAARPGYVEVLGQILNEGPRRLGLSLINAGVPGDTVRELQARLQADVLGHSPDWVFVLAGANDLLGAAAGAPHGVPPAEFEQALDHLVSAIAGARGRAILMTLTLYAEELEEPAAQLLKEYNHAIRQVAQRRALPLVDLARAFRDLYDRAATYKQQVSLTTDGIHPDSKGHTLIARAIVSDLGLLKKSP